MNADYTLNSLVSFSSGKPTPVEIHRAAQSQFYRVYRQGKLRRFLGKLFGQDTTLRTLAQRPITRPAHQQAIHYVPLSSIKGSEGRSADFDSHFNPLKAHNRERWIGIVKARRAGVTLPPVELVQVGEKYFVRDGHHRISVARAMGQLEIEAVIVN
jgi:hypothetical protein